MVILPSASMNVPAPLLANHSVALQNKALIGAALPDIAPHLVVAGLALAVLNQLRGRRQVSPGFRNLGAILVEQVLAVEQQAGIHVPRHGDELATDRTGGHCRREILVDGACGHGFRQIEQVAFQRTSPDAIEDHHVDIGRLCRQELLVERQHVVPVCRHGGDLHLVAGFLAPSFGTFLAELQFDAGRRAEDIDGFRLRDSRVGGREPEGGDAECENCARWTCFTPLLLNQIMDHNIEKFPAANGKFRYTL